MRDSELGIVIQCEMCEAHDWMSFASWYSIIKNLPDAEVIIAVERSAKKILFGWTRNKVLLIQYSKNLPTIPNKNTIYIPPTVMAVRSLDSAESIGPESVKSSNMPVFVDYLEGCGVFVTEEWINKKKAVPFRRAVKRFSAEAMTANEVAVLSLWEKCNLIYNTL